MWWIQKSSPNEFRHMEARARKFLGKLKQGRDTMKTIWFNLEKGYVTYQGKPMFPYFLVPEDETKWDDLFNLIEGKMVNLRGKSWTGQFIAAKSLDTKDFITQFAEKAGLKDLL